MKTKKLVTLIFTCIIFTCINSCTIKNKNKICSSYTSEEYIPVDLYDAIEYLNCIFSEETKQKFVFYFRKETFEDEIFDCEEFEDEEFEFEILDEEIDYEDFTDIFYFNYELGQRIRNNWGLWIGKNDLVKFFNSYEITHPDDMSLIILTSFYRKITNQNIDFEGQVQKYLDYWKELEDNYEKDAKRAFESYDKYKLEDSITIYLRYYNKSEGYVPCSILEWIFEPDKDLKLKGKIIQKEIVEDIPAVFFLLQVIDMNKNGTVKILGENVKVGYTVDVNINNLRYE